MIKLFLNQSRNVVLCAVNHEDVSTLSQVKAQTMRLPDELQNASFTRQQRAIAHQEGYQLLNRLWPEMAGCCSISHSKNITLLLYSQEPDVCYCGVDIEYFLIKSVVRGFMLDWLLYQPITDLAGWDMRRLTTILFCCMESLYKALSPYQPLTFNIKEYQLNQITQQYCLFSYIGEVIKTRVANIRCYYFEVDGYIISCVFLNAKLKSENNYCSFNISALLN